MLPLFFFFTSWIKKESDSGFTFLNLFLSPTFLTQHSLSYVWRIEFFGCDPFRPSGFRLSSLSPNLLFFLFTLRHPVGQLRQTRNFIIFSFAPNPLGLRDAESY
jgi:hypothetical protein